MLYVYTLIDKVATTYIDHTQIMFKIKQCIFIHNYLVV